MVPLRPHIPYEESASTEGYTGTVGELVQGS